MWSLQIWSQFTEEIVNGKLDFLFNQKIITKEKMLQLIKSKKSTEESTEKSTEVSKP